MADEVETAKASSPEQRDEAAAESASKPSEEASENVGQGDHRGRRNGKTEKKPVDRRPQGSKKFNSKPERLPESSDPVEIRKQVEFYFSDSNLAYDDFMSKLVSGSENKPVPIETIHSFKRMRRFQPFSAVVAALKESTTLNVVGEKEDMIQRKVAFVPPELDDEFNDPSIHRSIYAKGFGSDEKPTTQMEIEEFFAPYGPVNMVRLRRKLPKRDFKGSVFVEFQTEDLQTAFLKLESKPKWHGKELQVMSKEDYCKTKLDDVKSGKIAAEKAHYYKQYLPKSESHAGSREDKKDSNGSHRRGGNRGGRDRDDWKGRRDDFQKKKRLDEEFEKDDKVTESSDAAISNKRTREEADEAGDPEPEEKKAKT